MNLEAVTEHLKAEYRKATPKYRYDDDREIRSVNHRRLWTVLRSICLSFPFPISVLDAGCGTGRYFHCLENVQRLLGIDVSPDMLKAAQNPVLAHEISAARIELLCQNIFRASFPPGTFDFIYSLGDVWLRMSGHRKNLPSVFPVAQTRRQTLF